MKVRKADGSKFLPFDIILSVESEEEAKALYAIFNLSDNVSLLPDEAQYEVRHRIGERFAVNEPDEIARGVTYQDFYRCKEK